MDNETGSTPKDVYNAIQGKGLINGLLSTMNGQPAPEVGMGVTVFYGSDREPATVMVVEKNGKRIGIKSDTYAMKPGTTYYDQSYDITPAVAEEGDRLSWYTRRGDGKYRPEGYQGKSGAIQIGSRDKYQNPSF